MWITMCITDFPMVLDVDNFVENSASIAGAVEKIKTYLRLR